MNWYGPPTFWCFCCRLCLVNKSQQALSIIQLQSPYLFFVWPLRVSSLARDPTGSTSRAELWPPLCVNSFLLLWFKGLCLEVNPQVIHISLSLSGYSFLVQLWLFWNLFLRQDWPQTRGLPASATRFALLFRSFLSLLQLYRVPQWAAQAELHLEDVCQVTQTHHIPRWFVRSPTSVTLFSLGSLSLEKFSTLGCSESRVSGPLFSRKV